MKKRENRKNNHHGVSICYVPDNFVLAIGGRDCYGHSRIADVEYHDIAANTWNDFPSLNIGRSGAGSCVLSNKIFVFCGREKY